MDTGSKYDFYERQDVDVGWELIKNKKIGFFQFDPLQSDANRRWKSANVRIGLESRVIYKLIGILTNNV